MLARRLRQAALCRQLRPVLHARLTPHPASLCTLSSLLLGARHLQVPLTLEAGSIAPTTLGLMSSYSVPLKPSDRLSTGLQLRSTLPKLTVAYSRLVLSSNSASPAMSARGMLVYSSPAASMHPTPGMSSCTMLERAT